MKLGYVFSIILCIVVFCYDCSYGKLKSNSAKVTDIHIEIKDQPENKDELTELARKLIFLKKGDFFSENLLKSSIDALKLSNKFCEINIDSKEDGENFALLFYLKPCYYIKDIKIDKIYPLFEKDILNIMTIYSGDVYNPQKLPEQKKFITELVKSEGFIDPLVKVTALQDKEDDCYTVYVNIVKKDYYVLDNIEIKGNKAFSDSRLKLKIRPWYSSMLPGTPGRFVEKSLKKEVKALQEFYWKKKFPDAFVDYKIIEGSEHGHVSVILNINEGLKYDIEFDGNEEFWDYTLNKDVVVFERGNKNNSGLRKSVKNIKNRYKDAGYLGVKVKIDEEVIKEEEISIKKIKLSITEGPCSIINSIKITGNRAFEVKKIEEIMFSKLPGFFNKGIFLPQTLNEDIITIQSMYLKHGYMNAEVLDEVKFSGNKEKVDINVIIKENTQTIVSSIAVKGVTVISKQEALKNILLKKDVLFRKYMVKSDENLIASLISEKGYPHVVVKGEFVISKDGANADVVYNVQEGPFVKMGKSYYAGNFRTKKRILDDEFEISEDEPFSMVKMLETQRNIRNLNIFNSVKFKNIGLKEKNDEVNLFVEVEEKKPYFFELGWGYESDKNAFIKTKIGDHNLSGTNKDAWIGAEINQVGYKGELGITEPRLFKTKTAATFTSFAERKKEFNQDFGTKVYGASIGITKKWLQKITTGLSLRYERRDQFGDISDIEPEELEEYEPRSIIVTTPSIAYDTRDSLIRPQKGILSSFSTDISNGISSSMDSFVKYNIDMRYYVTPLKILTFACLLRGGYINPFKSGENLPDDQLFFLGGISDVRGYDENMFQYDENKDPVGGRTSINGSLEARVGLGLNFELALFYDIGSLTNSFGDINSDSKRSSAGAGIRYITPIGPVSFLYGFKLDKKEDESSGRFHFSLGYTF